VNELKTQRPRRRINAARHLSVAILPALLLARLLVGLGEDVRTQAPSAERAAPIAGAAGVLSGAHVLGCCDREPTGSVPAPAGRRRLTVPLALSGREPVCALALNPAADGAARAEPNVDVVLRGCRLFSNSSSAAAVSLSHSARLSALAVGAVGGIVGYEGIAAVLGVSAGNAPLQDPYRSLAMPEFAGCDQVNFAVRASAIADPGVYCGGMTLAAGAELTLKPGLYILDQGSLSVARGARLSGKGVTLVFTSSSGRDFATAALSPGAAIHLSAAAAGPMAGIVIFGDRRMPLAMPFRLEAGVDQVIAGATYVPRAALQLAGTSVGCVQIIADTITFTGSTRLTLACGEREAAPAAAAAAPAPSLYWLALDRPVSVSPSAP
jgi:hypothetical protein